MRKQFVQIFTISIMILSINSRIMETVEEMTEPSNNVSLTNQE
jgi:hypothetical protein